MCHSFSSGPCLYSLIRSVEAVGIIDEVNSPSIKVIFDIYHQQISKGHLIKNIVSNIDRIAHFLVAENPGRNELQNSEINYPAVFKAIQQNNFEGYVGLEYWGLNDNRVVALQKVAE